MADDHAGTVSTDVLVVGQLFVDAVYSGLSRAPTLGTETWDPSLTLAPGGIANHAVALCRLGADVQLRAAIGTGPLSVLGRSLLEAEGIALSGLTTTSGWDLPLTTSLSYDEDRALVTGGTPASIPIAELLVGAPRASVAIVHWDGEPDGMRALRSLAGTIIADIGADVVERHGTALPALLTGVDVFVPNAAEAMAITDSTTPDDALEALAEFIPMPVITLGSVGAIALDTRTGERVRSAALEVSVVDTTGAGDVFGAALALALPVELPLAAKIDFALLTAGLCVARAGGVAGAPTTLEVIAWLDEHTASPEFSRFDACRPALRLP